MAFVRVSPSALSTTPADFARNLQATIAAFQRAKGRRPVAVPLGRGMGATCSAFQNWVCANGGNYVQSVMGTPCSQCAVQPPTLAPGSVSPGLPVGYSADTGTVSTDNTAGATEANPYSPIYPNVPGASTCDMSAASWLDPSTWCAGNWAIAGAAALGFFLVLRPARGRR